MRVCLYARVSSDAQDVSLSVGGQLRAMREYATSHGYEVVREFVDEAESGRTALRPAFREMIALARTKSPPFEAILIWKLNRFSRSRLDSVTYKELLRQRGIRLMSITEPLEDSPSGKLLEGVLESIDEFYSANLGQDIKRGLREAARRGFFVGGTPPFGMHKVPLKDGSKTRFKLQPNPEGSPSIIMVRRMFEMAASGSGTKDIAKALNHDGMLSGTGHKWSKTSVHKILTNEAYCGTLVLGGRPGHPAIRTGEPPVRVEYAWPALVSEETFRLVQRKMTSKRPEARHPRTVSSFYLLSGLLYCSCGHAMVGRSAKSHQYYYYTCNRQLKEGFDHCVANSLPKDRLESLVIRQIKKRILNEEWLDELVTLVNEELDAENSAHHQRLQGIDAGLEGARARLSRLYDALETGKLGLDDLAPRIKELKKSIDELLKTRVLIEAELAAQGAARVAPETVLAYASDLGSLLDDAEAAERKSFLRSFVNRIVVDGDRVSVEYTLPLPGGQGRMTEEVLPTVNHGGAEGIRTPYLLNAIQ